MSAVRARRRLSGLTVVELAIALAIVGIIAAIAFPLYDDRREKIRIRQAINELTLLSTMIGSYQIDHGEYPPNLAAVGNAGYHDPWGRPYVYLGLQGLKGKGDMRKNKNLVPINSDFDLYSMGKDGDSRPPLTAKVSRDDVIRANDGRFYGLASDYEK
jgi:general secretion pathway protein G